MPAGVGMGVNQGRGLGVGVAAMPSGWRCLWTYPRLFLLRAREL